MPTIWLGLGTRALWHRLQLVGTLVANPSHAKEHTFSTLHVGPVSAESRRG